MPRATRNTPPRDRSQIPDPPELSTQPALLEWLRFVPDAHRAAYVNRAAALLGDSGDSPAAGGHVLRILIGERRLASHALRSEQSRRSNRKRMEAALKGMADAERDLQRAWADYSRERDRALSGKPASARAAGAVHVSSLI